MNAPETGTVASCHIKVEPLYSVGTAEFTELLVHVVRSGSRIIAEPDTEVLDGGGLLLEDLVERKWVRGMSTPADKMVQKTRPVMQLTSFTATISPVAFFTLRSLRKKYQKRDLATTSFGAKRRMR